MRTVVRMIVVGALVVAILPVASPAAVGSACSGTFGSTAPDFTQSQCTFFLAGAALSVQGVADDGFVLVAVSDATGSVYFMSCSSGMAVRGRVVNCQAAFGPGIVPAAASLPAGVPLTCYVAALGAGSFTCASSVL